MARLGALTIVWFTLLVPVALGSEGYSPGEGLLGHVDDMQITIAGFILIGFFPLFALVMSIIQWRLEKRKDQRLAAAKARRARAHERLGY